MPAGRYLLGAGHRVRVPLHQLLERDGLRVRSAGDLQTREKSARPPHPAFSLLPSLARVLPQGWGPGRWLREPARSRPEPSRRYLQPEERQAALGGGRGGGGDAALALVWVPRAVTNPRRKRARRAFRTHTWAAQTRWVSGNRADRPAPPRCSVYRRAVLRFCLTSELASVY